MERVVLGGEGWSSEEGGEGGVGVFCFALQFVFNFVLFAFRFSPFLGFDHAYLLCY